MRKVKEARFVLPWPPTANNSKVTGARGRFVSVKALRRYQEACGWTIVETGVVHVDPPYIVIMDLYEPDRRRRDICNYEKHAIDCLVKAGVIIDDCKINSLLIRRAGYHDGGRIVVQINHLEEMS